MKRDSRDAANREIREHPILEPVRRVVEAASQVRIDRDEIERVAGWMAAEELAWPDFGISRITGADPAEIMDFIFLTATINFAFTDFDSGQVFRVFDGGVWKSDSDAMMVCLERCLEAGIPILEGEWLRRVGKRELEEIFDGSIPIPMLEQRLRIFREVGESLAAHWGGRFHRFVAAGPPRLHGPQGLLERLPSEFPSFADVSLYRGRRVPFLKRAQLLFWQLHCRLGEDDFFQVEDLPRMTIFADYIVPMALRLFGVLVYRPELDQAIASRRLIPADSDQEIEIRAASIWACRLLTDAINRRRPPDRAIIDPVLDSRIWTHYHASHHPHHLTMTTDY